jgi:DNA (cytosine-5)-methyltransferase 1
MSTNSNIGFFSFFSGAGFLDLGLCDSGMDIMMSCEKHTPFVEINKHFNKSHIPLFGHYNSDIEYFLTENGISELKEMMETSKTKYHYVGFVGGPPCPDFSVAGKNKGKDGDNGKLSLDYNNLICEHRPDFFIFENVKGLYKTKKHREFFESLKTKLIESDYTLTEKLVNSISYGVPQDRDRIILIGTKKTLMDISELDWDKYVTHDKIEVMKKDWPSRDPFSEDGIIPAPMNIPLELTVEHWFRKNEVTTHPNSKHFLKPRAKGDKYHTIEEGDSSKMSGKRLHRWRYSPTVAYGNNEVHLHPYKPRRLTVAEALSLQSIPKDYSFPEHISLTNMFKAIGNGVPYLMALGIGRTLINHLQNGK